jgi:acetolactate synthase-1/3 small subunit
MIKRKILIILENKPGALARVVGLFHQRGYNIESLHVDAVENTSPYKNLENELNIKLKSNEVSKMTITTTVNDNLLTQILRQINKLIDVLVANEEN